VNIFLDGEDSSKITNYKLLIVLITHDSYTNEDIKKRISLGKATMVNLTRKLKRLERFNQHKR
jgi:adenine deaminase